MALLTPKFIIRKVKASLKIFIFFQIKLTLKVQKFIRFILSVKIYLLSIVYTVAHQHQFFTHF